MTALIIFLFFLAYIAVSIGVVIFAMNIAKKRGLPRWKYGVPAGLFMYLIVFWEVIPTLAVYKSYCAAEAGFVVYTSVDEWIAANPGEAEIQVYGEQHEVVRVDNESGYTTRTQLSQRFNRVYEINYFFLSVRQITSALVDRKTAKILMENTKFMSGGGRGFGLFTFQKTILRRSRCGSESKLESDKYINYYNKLREMGTILR